MISDEKQRLQWLERALRSAGLGSSISGIRIDTAIGDDCAVIAIEAPMKIVVGTDYVRAARFRLHELGFLSDADVARFCVTANISDVAAMGAKPLGFFAIVRYPPTMADEEFEAVMAAIDEECWSYGCALLGGDSGSAERLILGGSAIGVASNSPPLLRSSARSGDVVAVTGPVGGAGAAVLAAATGVVPALEPGTWNALLSCWSECRAHVQAGMALSATGRRVACQDVSDGLLATLREICERSQVAAVIDSEALPIHIGVPKVAKACGDIDSELLALSASADFCLCFTCAGEDYEGISRALEEIGQPPIRIGSIREGEGVWTRGREGAEAPAVGVEWRHQGGEIGQAISAALGDAASRRDG